MYKLFLLLVIVNKNGLKVIWGSIFVFWELKVFFEGIGYCIWGRIICVGFYKFFIGCYLVEGVSEFFVNKRGYFWNFFWVIDR